MIERSERTQTNNQYDVLSSTVKGIFSQREYFSKDIASENNVGYKIIRLHDIVLSPQNLWMGNINYNLCNLIIHLPFPCYFSVILPSSIPFTASERYFEESFIAYASLGFV